jgi:hypothetical protein
MREGTLDRAMAERWRLYRPPARPSAGDVAVYRSLMQAPTRTLLLGATPEIRSLAHQLGHRLTIVDRSEAVYQALTSMVKPLGAEEFHCGDWLEAEGGEQFDLVVGDGSLNMLPWAMHARFIDRVAARTRPGGRVLLHVHLMREPVFATAEDVFERFRESSQHIYTATKLHLSMLLVDRETGEVSNADVWRTLLDLRARGAIDEEPFRTLRDILEDDALSVHFVQEARFRELVAPCFAVESVHCAGDYELHEAKPIFCLRRRQNSATTASPTVSAPSAPEQ